MRSLATSDVRVFDLMKPFKEVPKEKLDDALNKLDIWSLGCVHLLDLRFAARLLLTPAPLPREARSRGRRRARRRGMWRRECCRA